MRIKNFSPAGNQILAKVKYYNTSTTGIVHKLKPEKDMFAEVVAVGPAAEGVKVGDLVMFGDVALMHLPFDDENNNQVVCVLASSFNVLATYTKDKDETRIFVPEEPSTKTPADGIQVLGDGALGEWGANNEELLN